jgi:ring-1,2-phenylacetyl-CoA epoxidase subunit PaaD
VVSEARTQATIARRRAGVPGATRNHAPTIAAVRASLAEVPDPELPVLSVVDLGIVHRVEVDPAGIRVAILPTFVGCPALDVIRGSIADRLGAFGVPVQVDTTFEVPWTSERISPAGRRALAAAGIAPPSAPEAVRCPFCTSPKVVMDNAFGPTQCRSLYYCRACRQPFEALKVV